MDQNKIDRINALYHKSKAVGLTEEEKAEQAALRKDNISIQEKDGSITDLGKKYGGIKDVQS